jgi:hypothetical protein
VRAGLYQQMLTEVTTSQSRHKTLSCRLHRRKLYSVQSETVVYRRECNSFLNKNKDLSHLLDTCVAFKDILALVPIPCCRDLLTDSHIPIGLPGMDCVYSYIVSMNVE